MKNEEGDINRNIGAILFVVLISLFAFAFDGKSDNSASFSSDYSSQADITPGYYSGHSDAVIFGTSHLPVVVKDSGCSFYSPNLNLFKLQFAILNYNRIIVQNIILVQKTRLSIEPASVWKYSSHPAAREKEDPPVLS
jgi:hypothetical protein